MKRKFTKLFREMRGNCQNFVTTITANGFFGFIELEGLLCDIKRFVLIHFREAIYYAETLFCCYKPTHPYL